MFVACQSKITKNLFAGKPRLYAFPAKPSLSAADKFVILDSGAYSLSRKNKEIDSKHMFRLGAYYKKYNGSDKPPVLAIAPDKFLDPEKTMDNYKFWRSNIDIDVVPVIQFKQKKRIDLMLACKQVDFYCSVNSRVPYTFAISNPSLTADDSAAMSFIIRHMKTKGVKWVHNLGAGWNVNDCRDWARIGFDSIDSISFYTDAARNLEWQPFSYNVSPSNLAERELIIKNYELANNAFVKEKKKHE